MDSKKTKGEKAKEIIIEKSAKLFLKNGYHHTGLSQILTECNIAKGTFYFYFKSKDDLGAAVADYFGKTTCDWFTSCLTKSKTFSDFINNICNDILDEIAEDTYYGCPFSCFATETSLQITSIARSCQKSILAIREIFSKALQLNGITEEEAENKSELLLAMYEGYLVCYRITKTSNVIDRMKKNIIEIA